MLIVAKQDNVDNLFAIWNTVTDRFLGVNLSYDDCIESVMEYSGCSYEDAENRVLHPQPFDDIAKQIYWGFEPDYTSEEPDDIKNAVRLIANHYKSDSDFRNAFTASILSAIEDINKTPNEMTDDELANHIARRITGEE